jgi:hypothetical protein
MSYHIRQQRLDSIQQKATTKITAAFRQRTPDEQLATLIGCQIADLPPVGSEAEAALFDALLASTAPVDPRDARQVAKAWQAFAQYLATERDPALLRRIITLLRTPPASYF